jgi:hypothetical protein
MNSSSNTPFSQHYRNNTSMFTNTRRTSYDNNQSCHESPIVVSSLTPFVPSDNTTRDRKFNNRYSKLKSEFHTASQTRQNTATLTNNYSPTVRHKNINRSTIVFPEYAPQKQSLYVRPKGLLQVDPTRFQITPSELTMMRRKHEGALTQVDVSEATGEVKVLDTPVSMTQRSCGYYSVTFPQSTATALSVDTPMHDSVQTEEDEMSLASSTISSRQRKLFTIPLPHSTIYKKMT